MSDSLETLRTILPLSCEAVRRALLRSTAKHLAWHSALIFIACEEHVAVDDRVIDPLGAFDQTRLPTRQIMAPLGTQRPNPPGVEDYKVRVIAWFQTSLARQAQEARRFGGQAPHAFFKTERTTFPDPFRQQIRRQAGIAMLRDMGTCIGKTDQRVG